MNKRQRLLIKIAEEAAEVAQAAAKAATKSKRGNKQLALEAADLTTLLRKATSRGLLCADEFSSRLLLNDTRWKHR